MVYAFRGKRGTNEHGSPLWSGGQAELPVNRTAAAPRVHIIATCEQRRLAGETIRQCRDMPENALSGACWGRAEPPQSASHTNPSQEPQDFSPRRFSTCITAVDKQPCQQVESVNIHL